MQLLDDPVVISSGYVVDRSTVCAADGGLSVELCPFTRQKLLPVVFPLRSMGEQLDNFKRARSFILHACMQSHVHRCRHAHNHTHMHTYAPAQARTHMHTCTHTYFTRVRMHTQTSKHVDI